VSRHHKKWVIIISLLCICIAQTLFYIFAQYRFSNFFAWLLFAIVTGVMLSINSLALLSYVAIHDEEKKHHMNFAFINIALNLSAGVGPFMGAVMLTRYREQFALLPIVFAILSIFACAFLARDKAINKHPTQHTKFHLGGRKFILFLGLNILTYIGYPQFYEVFPVYAMEAMNEEIVGILFIISSVVIVMMQLPIIAWVEKTSASFALAIANLLLAMGTLLFIPAAQNYLSLCILGVVLISIAEVVYSPLYQSLAISLFQPENRVLSLAILSFALGISEASATFVGIYAVGHGYGYISMIIGAFAALIVAAIAAKFSFTILPHSK
jgi:predicted MFS family arabinose efflux permease